MSKKSYFYIFIILLCVVAIATTRVVKTYNSYIEKQKQKTYVDADKDFMIGLYHEDTPQPISQAQANIPIQQYPEETAINQPKLDLLDKKINAEAVKKIAEEYKDDPKFNAALEEIRNLEVLKDKDLANLSDQDKIEMIQDEQFRTLALKYATDPDFLIFLQKVQTN